MPAAPTTSCKPEEGLLQPVINRSRCEGKDDCVRVCPYGVFEVRTLTPDEKAGFGAITRFKLFVHGGKQAFPVKTDECHACGKCVEACPEQAIKLEALTPP